MPTSWAITPCCAHEDSELLLSLLQKANRTGSVLYLAINDDTQVSGVTLTGIVSVSFFLFNVLARAYDHLTPVDCVIAVRFRILLFPIQSSSSSLL